MFKKLKQHREGFTIIEVLIVLAIAGLILLIVFLAVPALQRTARNTQRKNDAAGVLGAVSNYISNNGGSIPTHVLDNGTNQKDVCGNAACSGNKETAKLGYYDPGNVTIATAAPATFPDESHMVIVTGFACNATNTDIGAVASRTAIALFTVEKAVQQCVEQ